MSTWENQYVTPHTSKVTPPKYVANGDESFSGINRFIDKAAFTHISFKLSVYHFCSCLWAIKRLSIFTFFRIFLDPIKAFAVFCDFV